VLESLRALPAIIVGHCFGAGAATEFAPRYTLRSCALLLVDAALSLTSLPSDPPILLRSKLIGKVLVFWTNPNPLATKMLMLLIVADRAEGLRLAGPCRHPAASASAARQHRGYCALAVFFSGADVAARSPDPESSSRDSRGPEGYGPPMKQARDLENRLP